MTIEDGFFDCALTKKNKYKYRYRYKDRDKDKDKNKDKDKDKDKDNYHLDQGRVALEDGVFDGALAKRDLADL